jgi:GTPase
MFIDKVEISISGGHGGPGLVSFGKMAHSGPDGGNGGKGGDAYILAESDLTLLSQFSMETVFSAEDGHPGGKNKRTGRDGDDLVLKLPVGTTIIDKESGKNLFELTKVGQKELISEGGKAGRGNYEFRSPRRTTPMFAQPGLPGEKKELILDLKLIASFGLVGLPNAGKSSLLNELTNANAKTADYSFTTLSPNLGVLNGRVIADIPGLIEGASGGRGLGISFLKHIEKVKVILHCLSVNSENPIKDYKIIRHEMQKYNKKLLDKKEILLLTKSDMVDHKKLKQMTLKMKKYSDHIFTVSIHDWESLEYLKKILLEMK